MQQIIVMLFSFVRPIIRHVRVLLRRPRPAAGGAAGGADLQTRTPRRPLSKGGRRPLLSGRRPLLPFDVLVSSLDLNKFNVVELHPILRATTTNV